MYAHFHDRKATRKAVHLLAAGENAFEAELADRFVDVGGVHFEPAAALAHHQVDQLIGRRRLARWCIVVSFSGFALRVR